MDDGSQTVRKALLDPLVIVAVVGLYGVYVAGDMLLSPWFCDQMPVDLEPMATPSGASPGERSRGSRSFRPGPA